MNKPRRKNIVTSGHFKLFLFKVRESFTPPAIWIRVNGLKFVLAFAVKMCQQGYHFKYFIQTIIKSSLLYDCRPKVSENLTWGQINKAPADTAL
jgi:hypothetical protein